MTLLNRATTTKPMRKNKSIISPKINIKCVPCLQVLCTDKLETAKFKNETSLKIYIKILKHQYFISGCFLKETCPALNPEISYGDLVLETMQRIETFHHKTIELGRTQSCRHTHPIWHGFPSTNSQIKVPVEISLGRLISQLTGTHLILPS